MNGNELKIDGLVYLVNSDISKIYLNEYKVESFENDKAVLIGIKSIYKDDTTKPYSGKIIVDKSYLEIPLTKRLEMNIEDLKRFNKKVLESKNS